MNLSKYDFLLSLKSIDFQIRELEKMSEQVDVCYVLLRKKVDELSSYVVNQRNQELWETWCEDSDVKEQVGFIRESAVNAICNLEKYESHEIISGRYESSSYLNNLSKQLKDEIEIYRMNKDSYILFIGSGALPLSALTIAKNTGAKMMCVDIDEETIPLAREATAKLGLQTQIEFTSDKVSQLVDRGQYTHAVIASLVNEKVKLIDELAQSIQPEAKVIVRYGDGLKSLFNYPSSFFLSSNWQVEKHEKDDFFYDTALIKWIPTNVVGVEG
ncbi:nicotianamine synthase family protein [Longirhabdus pacifica]|uniref:nicotianamine synthase family protein n=1 Tax=Longirhabdus pacifica TaxID=2305227 RepID=UPI001008D9B8|nr:nicotianamine synthase family protein [Longirhabdus pacifica]